MKLKKKFFVILTNKKNYVIIYKSICQLEAVINDCVNEIL